MLIKEMKAEEKLKSILELIDEGKDLREIAKIAGYAKKSNVKDFLKSKGYIFNGDSICGLDQKQEEELKVQEIQQVQSNDIHMTDSFMIELQNKQLQSNLLALAKQYEEIQEMLVKVKSLDSQVTDTKQEVITVVQEGIKIDLPDYEGQAYRASVRINPVVWQEFDEFASQHKEFEKASLIAQAMKEYMEKHR